MATLFSAIEDRDLAQLNRLIKNGANVDEVDKYGQTPLFKAVLSDWKLVKALVKAGASADIKDKDGNTVFQIMYGDKIPSLKSLLTRRKNAKANAPEAGKLDQLIGKEEWRAKAAATKAKLINLVHAVKSTDLAFQELRAMIMKLKDEGHLAGGAWFGITQK